MGDFSLDDKRRLADAYSAVRTLEARAQAAEDEIGTLNGRLAQAERAIKSLQDEVTRIKGAT